MRAPNGGTKLGSSEEWPSMKPWLALLLLVVALAARLQFLSGWASNFDSDEALVALTTRDLLHGRFHIFLPGQNYMGAIERITAAPFVALSHHPGAVRMAPLLWTVLGAFVFARLVSRGARPRGGGFSGPTGRDSLSGPIEPDAPAGRLGWNALVVWCLPPRSSSWPGSRREGETWTPLCSAWPARSSPGPALPRRPAIRSRAAAWWQAIRSRAAAWRQAIRNRGPARAARS